MKIFITWRHHDNKSLYFLSALINVSNTRKFPIQNKNTQENNVNNDQTYETPQFSPSPHKTQRLLCYKHFHLTFSALRTLVQIYECRISQFYLFNDVVSYGFVFRYLIKQKNFGFVNKFATTTVDTNEMNETLTYL